MLKVLFNSPKYLGRRLPFLIISMILLLSISCSNDNELPCESNNFGTVGIQNTDPNGTLQVYINRNNININGVGDITIPSGESVNTEVDPGQHILYAVLIISNCVGSDCQLSGNELPERNVDINACEEINLVY